MGLLTKASSDNISKAPSDEKKEPAGEETQAGADLQDADYSLDEMGKALSERIGRLSKQSSTPYTALSLLKAYGAFQTGICLTLKNDVYTSYTSLGLGVGQISIPLEKILSKERNQIPYFRLDATGEPHFDNSTPQEPGGSSGIKSFAQEGFSYWIFPLDLSKLNTAEPWREIMILGVSDTANTNFNPRSIFNVILNTADKFLIGGERSIADSSEEIKPTDIYSRQFCSVDTDTLKEKITEYYRIHSDFNCILLEIPVFPDEEERTGFCKRISKMLSLTGTVLSLPDSRPLILLPKMIDRELIAHRLSKSLNTKILKSFEADSPENVFSQISSLS